MLSVQCCPAFVWHSYAHGPCLTYALGGAALETQQVIPEAVDVLRLQTSMLATVHCLLTACAAATEERFDLRGPYSNEG